MRTLVIALAILGCTRQAQPESRVQPDQQVQPEQQVRPERQVQPEQQPQLQQQPPPPVQPPPDAGVAAVPANLELGEGIGTCKKDDDCMLSNWQEGCCLTTCEDYVISKLELTARMKKENCPPPGTKLCPPPAPCPLQQYRTQSAVCVKGRCMSRREPITRKP